jgi:uncharacterized membrane protein YphA (DoxX/SURF4 family)
MISQSPTVSANLMEQIKSFSNRAEITLNKAAAPLKPHLSHIGRFLLVVTFMEDCIRILMQWSDQIRFMNYYRHWPLSLSHLFLALNVTLMAAGSMMALTRYKTPIACGMLGGVLAIQTLGYGLLFHATFMLRNFSLIGGILLLLAEHINNPSPSSRSRAVPLFTGVPVLTEMEKGTYVSLFGRVLLILLFAAMGLQGKFTLLKSIFFMLSMISSIMVAVGFKARYSAMFLVAILSISNIVMNPWWSYRSDSPEHDFLRYDFFQVLSIMGGFLLLANSGPGEISVDEAKKKDF